MSSSRSESTQPIPSSLQCPLFLPPWVRPISSPWAIIGTPCDRSRVVRKLRSCRQRRAVITASSVGPSTPQFHDRLWPSPSALPSSLASLCLSLYETRSVSVKPSCAVTKLIEAIGLRPVCSYRSEEPESRLANSEHT